MKIEIKDLRPNPFRNVDAYPIDRNKIKSLIRSIEDTTFWDNILARPYPDNKGLYQIAYGHHRLIALKEIHGQRSTFEVNIPVRELDDALMLKIMANENASEWAMNTAVISETVKAAEAFIGKHPDSLPKANIQKYSGKAEAIADFLGGVFSEVSVAQALAVIHAVENKEVDERAVKRIKEPQRAAAFVAAVRASEKPVPVQAQRQIAKDLEADKINRSEVKDQLRYHGYPQKKEKEVPPLWKFLNKNGWKVEEITKYVRALTKNRADLSGLEWTVFKRKCVELQNALNELLDGKGVNSNGKEARTDTVGQNRRLLIGKSR